jgi:hypothetical protein
MFKLSLAGGLAAVLMLSTSAWALECPAPADINDPATAAAIAKILPADIDLDAPDALQSAVFDLQQAGVANDVILDNLIAVYCAVVDAQTGLSDDDKTQSVETFSQQATQVVFSGAD